MVSTSYSAYATLNVCLNLGVTCVICHCLDLCTENCPDHNPSLSSWNPGHQPQKAVVVKRGQLFKLETSSTLLSLTIQSGGNHINLHDFFMDIYN